MEYFIWVICGKIMDAFISFGVGCMLLWFTLKLNPEFVNNDFLNVLDMLACYSIFYTIISIFLAAYIEIKKNKIKIKADKNIA